MSNGKITPGRREIGLTIAVVLLWCAAGSAPAQVVSTDLDGDGISNGVDNCTMVVNPNQVDADEDGYGNRCDADINNDGAINFADYFLLANEFLGTDPVADLNVDGTVNFGDLALFSSVFLGTPGPSGVVASAQNFQATRVFQAIDTSGAIDLKQAPGQPHRWYLLKRSGEIISFSTDGNTTTSTPVLNISAQVDTNFEGGALGFSFDPNFASNGYVYISYTATGPNFAIPLVSRVSRFETAMVNGVAIGDGFSELVNISVDQPYANHNGGGLEFGPDGFLYWGLGDGGSSGDPQRNGQNTNTLLGSMLRIDINVTAAEIAQGIRYKIPPDNPFAENVSCVVIGSTGCPEIYAWGVRNPWRWSFDRVTGLLWAGDVGQNAIEEISVIVAGKNYGWRCYEGDQVYNTSGCDLSASFEPPVHAYTHALGYSVTGGYVYRGTAHPQLHGMYVFADYGSGTLWGIYEGDYIGMLLNTGKSVVSFAQDSQGELYFLDLDFFGNGIYRLDIN